MQQATVHLPDRCGRFASDVKIRLTSCAMLGNLHVKDDVKTEGQAPSISKVLTQIFRAFGANDWGHDDIL